jgi:release factor glutamine methyltransferase
VSDQVVDPFVAQLASAGCIAAEEELAELRVACIDDVHLATLVARRCAGAPLAWLVGTSAVCGLRVRVAPRVYVPRPHTELLAEAAVERMTPSGRAIDLCTGSGAIAATLIDRRPSATVVATDLDPVACTCARSNGVTTFDGDLYEGVDPAWHGTVDVVVGVLPYVPHDELDYLPRDVIDHEPRLALDGGDAGLAVVARAIAQAPTWLRDGGTLLLELGGRQAALVEPLLDAAGMTLERVITDEDDDPRGVLATKRA